METFLPRILKGKSFDKKKMQLFSLESTKVHRRRIDVDGKAPLKSCCPSLLSGCSQPEVYRLLRSGFSGYPGWKNGEFMTRYACEEQCGSPGKQLSALSPPPQSLKVVFREPLPSQPQANSSPPPQLVSMYHHLESVINTACFNLWTGLL